jgi:purine nucleosidase
MARRALLVAAALAALALLSLALPVPVWRTGELPAPPLPVVRAGPQVEMPRRVWVDTDAACGRGRTSDPDDCFALLLLDREPGLEIVGISTVHGNAPLAVTDATTRRLAQALARDGAPAVPVHRGSAAPIPEHGSDAAQAALRRALADGPLTLVSLGPLTNIAAALEGRPDLQAHVARLVAVMGRRQGHLFHPSEGAGGGMLLGHGPVFRDLNVAKDPAAVAAVLAMRLPTTFLPYEAARQIILTGNDLAAIAAQGGAAAQVAGSARGWLDFWRVDVGREGFYPFDLLAGAYALAPHLFDCAQAHAWVGPDLRLWHIRRAPDALLVGLERELPPRPRVSARVIYCTGIDPRLHAWLMDRLAAPPPSARQGNAS